MADKIPAKNLYFPSSGTEGAMFMFNWCDRCTKHPLSYNARHQCQILLNTYAGSPQKQWIYENGKPVCTAFKSRQEQNEKRRQERKKHPRRYTPTGTLDLFSGDKQ